MVEMNRNAGSTLKQARHSQFSQNTRLHKT